MTEGVQRELRDQISQTSKPRIEEAESSRSSRESTSWGQPGSRTSTSTTSTATSTASLTIVSEKMSSPTPAVQPHWKAETKLTSKGKELENKSVKDQRPGFKENDMRDHLSGYNDEDEDQSSLKLDIGRPDEEEDQGPNMEDEQDDAHDQVSRRNNNQVAGVETQNPAYEKPHSQANGDEHDDFHNQVYGRHSQVLGVEPQVSTSRRPNNQVTGVEAQVSSDWGGLNTQKTTGVGAQVSTPRRPNKQVTGREVQSSDSEEFMAQPPCCLPHSCKTNIVFTERLLLRNSSKDTDKSDKNFRKEVKVLEFMNWLKAVFEFSALTTAFHLSMDPGFHNNSTKSLESPQASLGHAAQQQTEKEGKKNLFEEPGGTVRFTYFYSLLVLLVLILLIGTTSNKVHQLTSTDGLGVITVKPIVAYRGFGEDSEFLNDCLATQIETIIQELEKGGRSDPRFLSLIKNQKRPQNETIIEKLEKRGCSGPRFFILLKNRKDPKNEKELEKGGRSDPRFLDLIKNKKRSKNETIDGELEERWP